MKSSINGESKMDSNVDNEINNVFSIWTRKKPCDKLTLSNREFMNECSTPEGSAHFTNCHDCRNRYSMVAKLLMQTMGR